MDDVTSLVARQYTDFTYPEPFPDVAAWSEAGHIDMSDPRHFGPLLWPEGAPGRPLRILVAGCGTVQASVIAFSNPAAEVVGVDLSEASLAHQRYLRERHGLTNLTLYQGDLREVEKLGRQFDLIVSTGVLHHLPDPDVGLKALAGVLAPGGAMFLMVYGGVGRAGVYLLQDAFRRLGLRQVPEDIALVRTVLDQLPPSHFVQFYKSKAADLAFESGVVDTFLHPQDKGYSVPEILAWAAGAGLGFQCWSDNAFHYPDAFVTPALHPRLAALPETEQWAVVEDVLCMPLTHAFVLRHPAEVHAVSFEGADWLGYRPFKMPGAHLLETPEGLRIHRSGINFTVNPAEAAGFTWGDGSRTIGQMSDDPALAAHPLEAREAFLKAHFQRMWRLGLMMFQR